MGYKRTVHCRRLLIAVLALFSWKVPATQDQNYGLNATTSGRVGAVTAESDNAFAAIYNPATLAGGDRPLFSFATIGTGTQFNTLKNVTLDSPQYRTSDGVLRVGDYTPKVASRALWSSGLKLPFRLPRALGERRAGFGLVVSGPFDSLRTFHAPTPYDFQTLRYGTSDIQFKGTLGGAIEIVPETLFFGAGLSLYVTSAGNAETTLVTENPTGRFALDVGMNTAGVLGLYYRGEPANWGLVYRQEIAPSFEQRFTGSIRVGNGGAVIQPLLFRSTLYFEPHTLETELQKNLGPLVASIGVSYQMWSRYKASSLSATTQDSRGTTVTTLMPTISLRDTWNPRASMDIPLWQGAWHLAIGYRYRPTPLVDTSGSGNILDASAHIFGTSLQHEFGESAAFPWKVRIGAYGQYHFLQTLQVRKASAQYIGAPGYDYSGNAFAYGVSLQAGL